MMRIIAIIQPFMFQRVCEALRAIDDLPGLTVSDVIGWGKGRGVATSDVVKNRTGDPLSQNRVLTHRSPA